MIHFIKLRKPEYLKKKKKSTICRMWDKFYQVDFTVGRDSSWQF